ncbi:MAG: hypothetical protein GX437_06585 [Sphingobacteriales bacterium]|nr:hypothetical protein [Sphingobacteriales bacterium]
MMMKKTQTLVILLLVQCSLSFSQSKGDLLFAGFISPGYAFDDKYSGIGTQLGVELTYNLTEKVPFTLFADFELFRKMPIISGGFRVAYLYTVKEQKYIELRGTLGGSTIFGPDDDFPGMGMRLGFSVHYKALPMKNICFYLGPSFNASLDGLYDPLFVNFDAGIGYYIW